ncbi:iron-containing alcohol dehydrogenase, partial [Pelagibacteraceae bacterium]|nr:iron-containing alcohol dehydrogenase [Pelagibacteraceae bacterium]
MNNFSFSSINELKILLSDKKFKKILIICGEISYKKSGAEKLLNKLLFNKQKIFFFKKLPYPDINELKDIISAVKVNSPDLIIAIGGGSVIDYAKIANVLTDSSNLDQEIINTSYDNKKKFTKLVAIPTTAGSGAEVTSNAVIYINKIKYSVEGDKLKPDYFFLIPELVIGASNKIKSSAGFDAIAQAMESLISKKSNEKSVEFAKKSLQISLKYYLDFINKPNSQNTSAMCLAANLSGKAISISKTTAPHAVSYPFTAIYNVSHGHAV